MPANILIQQIVLGCEPHSDTNVSMTFSHLYIIERKKANKGVIAVVVCYRPACEWQEFYKVFNERMMAGLGFQREI